jgi:hypothetical protein
MTSILVLIDQFIIQHTTYIYFVTLLFLHVSYFLMYFKIMKIDEKIINYSDIAIQSFICFVLLLRFNPWRKVQMTDYDRVIIFGSAVILLGNLTISKLFLNTIENIYKEKIIRN